MGRRDDSFGAVPDKTTQERQERVARAVHNRNRPRAAPNAGSVAGAVLFAGALVAVGVGVVHHYRR